MYMETAQSVIKKFMKSLDDTSQQGIAAVDEAIRAASAGRFYNMRSVWAAFVRDASGLLGTNADKTRIDSFLKTYCDVDLHNNDTGAISGLDAGGSTVAKTAESVIPDIASTNTYWNSLYTVQGVNFHVDNPQSLTSAQVHMCRLIQRWWIDKALAVIRDSYGISLDEAGSKIKDIHIRFTKPASETQARWDGMLACVGDGQRSSELVLSINLDHMQIVDFNKDGSINYNGIMKNVKNPQNQYYEEYFDRTLTHELVHAVMRSTINNHGALPASIKEGLAELVHGIDDARTGNIYHVFQAHTASDWWSKLLEPKTTYDSATDTYHSDTYAAGYIFLRYLAKQLAQAANLPAAKVFDKSGQTVTLGARFTPNTIDLRQEAPFVRNADARAVTHATNVYGDAENNVLYASNKGGTLRGFTGNDTLYGGSGKDTFYYANGDGNDTIRNYGSGVDVVQVASGAVTTQVSGYDLLLKVGTGSIRIVDGTTKNVLLKEGNKAVRTIKGYKKLPTMAAYNANQTAVTLKAAAKNTFDARSYNPSIRTIDGRAANAGVNIYGNAAANTIYAGKKGGLLRGFGGNDTLYGGAGVDTFYYANGDGADVIRNYESNKDIIQIGSGAISGTTVYGNDVTFTVGKGSIKVIGGAGKTFRFKDAKNKVTTRRVDFRALPRGAAYAANYTQVNLSAAFADKSFDARAYRSSIRNIDARGAKKQAVTIYGNANANTIYASAKGGLLRGFGGNDTLYGGAGVDTFYYANGDGADVIRNYESNKDIIQIGSGAISKTTVYGSDVTFTIGKGSIKVIGGAGKIFRFKDAKNKVTTRRVDFLALPKGASYAANYTRVNLASGFSGRVEANAYRPTIQTIDASRTSRAVTLYGNSKANRLVAGQGGSTLRGFGGDDTLVGGNGVDTFYFGKGDGKVTVDNFESAKDWIRLYDSNSYTSNVNTSAKTVTIQAGGKQTLTIRGGYGKWIGLQTANGAKTSLRYYNGDRQVQTYYFKDQRYITCGSWRDVLYMHANSGKYVINNMQKNDILYLQNVANINQIYANVKNSVLTVGIYGSSMETRFTNWKQGQSFQVVYGNESSHRLHTLSTSGSKVSISR
ncbi:Ca2+-binding protein, RTX toxin-related [Selenomonas ruminantium]|uniref:Ca2+-binding protein, RTX toxin-related n=1 Tax=Selenomonas ruminantium TaxID=971 RepID=A0A1I3EFZ7_SELRU|nr:calcium-binding protein [Selenomonas ruminantium]SFH97915.1 Ca2+-binding protein, RTX toxin-related [Selenomonas ruminantium]